MLPALPLPSIAPGKRYTVPRPLGSADALLLAQFAQARKAQGQLTAIITADPADAQRLIDEIG
jgi:transcription-repair coupling factor (superfamily II helicase)